MNDEEGEFRKELLFFFGVWYTFMIDLGKGITIEITLKTKNKVFYAFSILKIIYRNFVVLGCKRE